MGRLLILILCLWNLLILVLCSEHEIHDEPLAADRPYDLNDALRKSLLRLEQTGGLRDGTVTQQLSDRKLREIFLDPSNDWFQNSTKCRDDLLYTAQSLKDQWASRMLDSFGKPESGILQGNFKWLGDYSECIQVRAPPKPNSTAGGFRGKYCTLTLTVANTSVGVTSGICIPSTCSPPEIRDPNQPFLQMTEVNPSSNGTESPLKITALTCKATERTLTAAAKAVIAILSLFCVLAAFGSSITAIKYFKQTFIQSRQGLIGNDPGKVPSDSLQGPGAEDELLLRNATPSSGFLRKCETFLSCFCVFRNGYKILNTSTTEGELLCIHGIRFLSMSWVILGHTYAFSLTGAKNLADIMNYIDNFPFQIVLQGLYSVDSFFVLSGFLLTYLSMQQFSKTKGQMSWPYFYIHRYMRLTPVYMLVLGFSASVYFFLGSGPFWPDNTSDPVCKENWCWNLLYINNFKGMAAQCMSWTWYLANDMQFFVISPVFLISLWRWPKIGYSVLAVFFCATFIANFYITYHYDLPCGWLGINGAGGNIRNIQDFLLKKLPIYMDKLYVKPYTRIGPYLVGISVAYLLFRRKMSREPKHSWFFLLAGWIVASAVTLAVVYGLYHRDLPLVTRSLYNATSRTCFAAGLAWVLYVCLVGQGGFVNTILSWKFLIPLSRLTYVAYLIHPLIITGYISSLKALFIFTHPTMVVLFLGLLVITYALALPVALLFESPVISLEKLARNCFIKDKGTQSTN